jgi:thiamine-phosphate pyrophosphorylase
VEPCDGKNVYRKIDLRLCIITDAGMVSNRSVERVVLGAIEGGASLIQYREKNATMREKYGAASRLCSIVKEQGVPFMVNDHADLAVAVRADGVHLGQDDLPVCAARRILGAGSVIGVSAGSVAEALQAQSDGAEYVSVGPVYPTRTKPDAGPAVSPELVREIVRAVQIPVVVIGGINASNVEAVMALGVSGVAVVSAVMKAEKPAHATREIAEIIERFGSKNCAN